MKICKLYVAWPVKMCYFLMALAWPLIGMFGIAAAATGAFGPDPGASGIGIWVFVFVLFSGLYASYSWLSFPYEIRMQENALEFRSLMRNRVVPVATIRSMRAKPYALGFVDLQHERGTIHLVSQMDGFHEFVSAVKSLNPAAKIEGC